MYVFLSYSRRDADLAAFVGAEIERRGMGLWQDRQAIEAGTDWGEEIALGIAHAAGFVVLLTENACAESRYVSRELTYAIGRQIPIAALSVPGLVLPEHLKLLIGSLQLAEIDPSDAEQVGRMLGRALERLGLSRDEDRPRAPSVTNASLDRRVVWPSFVVFSRADPAARAGMIKELHAALSARPGFGMANLNLALALAAQGRHDSAAPYFAAAIAAMPDDPECAYYAALNGLKGRNFRRLSLQEAEAFYALLRDRIHDGSAKCHHVMLLAAIVAEYFRPFGMGGGKPDVDSLLILAPRLTIDVDELVRALVMAKVRDQAIIALAQSLSQGIGVA